MLCTAIYTENIITKLQNSNQDSRFLDGSELNRALNNQAQLFIHMCHFLRLLHYLTPTSLLKALFSLLFNVVV